MDQLLISRAQSKAGRHVHNLAEIIQAIVLAEKCLKDDELSFEDRKDFQAIVERNECKLRAFIATGTLGEKC